MKNHLIHHIIAIPFITMPPLHPSKRAIKNKIKLQITKRKKKTRKREREEGKRNNT